MKIRRGLAGIIGVLFLVMLIGCQENLQDIQQTNGEKSGKVIIRITDAPLPLELVAEANVTVDWVKLGTDWKSEANNEDEAEDDNENEDFHLIEMDEALTFNLLELSNGVTAVLAETEIPAGEYNEVRLHITNAEIVLKDGSVYDLKVPGGGSSGLKVKVRPSIIVSGGTVAEVLLDFDVSRSFIVKGNLGKGKGKGKQVVNGFIFKPVVRAVNKTVTGQISGLVSDAANVSMENAMIALISGNDTVTTALTDNEGFYALIGVPKGNYSVACSKEGYNEKVAGDVNVLPGNITEQHFELVKEEENLSEENEE